MKYIDSHAHLSQGDYALDLDETINKAVRNDVIHIIDNTDSLDSFENVLNTKKIYPNIIKAAIGIHPEFSGKGEDYLNTAIDFITSHIDQIDAIGECGLDYHYLNGTSKEDELNTFRAMASIAKKYSKPLVVHSREAFDDTYSILKEIRPDKIQLHCFCYSKEEAKQLIDLGLNIKFSFGGVLTFKNSAINQEAMLSIPEDMLMLETDSPCLSPMPYRGKRNEPSYIPLIFDKICSLKNLKSFEERNSLADKLYKNTMDFFEVK